MSAHHHATTVALFAALAIASAGTAPALASEPVPKTITGCVSSGKFKSTDGYNIRPTDANGKAVDLLPYEGHMMTIGGNLLPGDILIVNTVTRDDGPCKMKNPG